MQMTKNGFVFLIFLCCFLANSSVAQKPKNGIYTYKVSYAEWSGKSLGASCIVRIKGDSCIVVNDGTISWGKR